MILVSKVLAEKDLQKWVLIQPKTEQILPKKVSKIWQVFLSRGTVVAQATAFESVWNAKASRRASANMRGPKYL